MILVTGGMGFIGSHLVEALKKKGEDVYVMDLKCGKNILNESDYPEKVDLIYHLAAHARISPSVKRPLEYHENNLTGTLKVLLYAQRVGAKVVFASSSSVYGNTAIFPTPELIYTAPTNPYSLQKMMCEWYCRLYGNCTIIRYFNVYGEGQDDEGENATVIGILLKQYRERKPFTIHGGTQVRDFTHVSDAVDCTIRAGELLLQDGISRVFNVGTGQCCSLLYVADMIDSNHPKDIQPGRPFEYKKTQADIYEAKRLLGYFPKVELKKWITDYLTK